MYHISHYNNIITTIILKNIIQGNVCIYCNTNSFILIQDRIKRNYTITGHAGKIWLFAVLSVYISIELISENYVRLIINYAKIRVIFPFPCT